MDIVKRLRAMDYEQFWQAPATSYRDCQEAAAEIERLRELVADYEQMQRQHREHVRRLDVALNGDGAAKQASLIDLVSQFERR